MSGRLGGERPSHNFPHSLTPPLAHSTAEQLIKNVALLPLVRPGRFAVQISKISAFLR
jgi:hypothetical protein